MLRLLIQMRNYAVLAFLLMTLIVCQISVQASENNKQNTSSYFQSYQLKNQSVEITTSLGKLSLSAFSNNAIQVHYQYQQKTNDASFLPSFAIKENTTQQNFKITETTKQLVLFAGELQAVINKAPFNISFYQNNRLLISQESGLFSGNVVEDEKHYKTQGFRFTLTDNEKLLGGGERVLGMDRRGHRMPLYNRAHYGYETQSNQMNFSLPAVFSSNKYILLFDNSAKGWMDLGKTDPNIMQFEAVSGRMAYLVFAGDTYPELINNYVDVTGKQPMPPRWAFGNYASRFGYRTEQEVHDTVSKFHELDFPLDALILDLYWFGKDIKGHMGNLDWDKAAFPTPTKMIDNLKKKGINTVLITEPFVLTSSKKWQDAEKNQALAKDADGKPKRFDFYFGNTGLIDVFNDNGKSWFNNIYKGLYQQGVSGWWGDLGEPEVHPSDTLHTLANGRIVNADAIHNVYGHQWAKMVFENQLDLAPKKRPFILMRAGFAGSQRYGMIPWTGDVSRSWGGLKPQVELSLQMGVLGMGYTHSDLGGFADGEKFDKALYIRWLQYGVFQPIYRPHAQDNIAPEVVFHDKETQDILRKFIKLRYNLLPYNYTLAYENSTTGMPLMRPIFFEDESNIALMNNATSYLWGDAFLVTPVVDIGVKSVSVPLPKGVWFDYFSGERHQGNQTVNIATSLETLPVLVRAGSFIPMIDDIQSTKDYDHNKLTLHYYADKSVKSSKGEMYDDDGEMFQANTHGFFELLSFEARQQSESLSLHLSRNNTRYVGMPKNRDITLVIHHWQSPPSKVIVGEKTATNFNWNKAKQTLTVKFKWQHQPLTLSILN